MSKSLVTESLISEMRVVDKDSNSPALCIMEGPCMEFDKVNRNNRIYSKKLVEDRILNNSVVQEALKNKCMLGEGGHPETRVEISYPDVALCVEKLWIPKDSKNLLWGRFAILDTPVGHILETLVKYGSKIGISARAMTDSVEKDGHEVISETTYDLITFDAVPDPGFKSARLSKVESAMRPIDSMTIPELQSASSSLKSAKVPAFESRIRMIDKEIERRKSLDLATEVNTLKQTLEMVKKVHSLSKVKVEDVEDILEQAKQCIKNTKESLDVFKRSQKEYLEELDILRDENKALHQQLECLDNALYAKSLSPLYEQQMNHLNTLVRRIESLNTASPKKESFGDSKFSNRYCVKESRIKTLLSNSNEGSVSARDSQKIAQFEREPDDILNIDESIEFVDDSLTRSIRAQIRR